MSALYGQTIRGETDPSGNKFHSEWKRSLDQVEIRAYSANWQRLTEEIAMSPAIANSDALFRIMDDPDVTWIHVVSSLDDNTSALHNSAVGSIFVSLVDGDRLSSESAEALGALLVAVSPQVMELEGFSPPRDASLPEVFHAAFGPASLGNSIEKLDSLDLSSLAQTVDELLQSQPEEQISSASEFMGYVLRWRDAMQEARPHGAGILVFFA
jgi:hypothetical protein